MKVKEIAKLLGLSPATVSLVINNRPGISEATRDRVKRALEEYGFEAPSIDTKAHREPGIIQFVVYRRHGVNPQETPYFSQLFSDLIQAVERQTKARGYRVMVSYLDEAHVEAQVEDLLRMTCDGFLVLGTEMTEDQVRHFEGKPLVLMDNYLECLPCDSVKINNELGVYQAVSYLAERGHRRIGYLHVDANANNFTERYFGFLRAMDRCGLELRKDDIHRFSTANGGEAVYQALRDALAAPEGDLPTAFFADNDIIASYALRVLRERGISVPGDVSLVGFDNAGFAAVLDPPLTTIGVDKEKIGVTAVNAIIDTINARRVDGPLRIEVGTNLVERESVRRLN